MHSIKELLGHDRLYADGGTGTILQAKGLKGGELPENWNLHHPKKIHDLHASYIEAGANLITTNTFNINPLRIKEHRDDMIDAAIRIANEARDDSPRDDIFIGLDIGPTGRMLSPIGDLSFDDAVASFADVIGTAASFGGIDYIMIETMSDGLEAKAAVLAAKESCDLPVFVTMIFDENKTLLTGGTPESVVPMLEGLRVDALGVNCGRGPSALLPVIEQICAIATVPIIVNPNAGLPNPDGTYDVTPDGFTEEMKKIAHLGVSVLGGCCGTTPAHIRHMIDTVRHVPFSRHIPDSKTVVSSFSRSVVISDRPVIIGERINPTGKKMLQQALRDQDMDYILKEGLREEEAGADILDINVGLPGTDEVALMRRAVPALQSVSPCPLQLDSSDPAALEAGLRLYHGKPLINSVSAKQDVMDAVFPLAAKYGGVVVILPLNERGIPRTASARLAICERVIEVAATYGIFKEDLLLDGLAMTISADPSMANVALETIMRARKELGLRTILGVSNISFGLPMRSSINAHFLTMAMTLGLGAAIMDPTNDEMMRAYRSFNALRGYDEHLEEYIAAYAGMTSVPNISTTTASTTVSASQGEHSGNMSIADAIMKGLSDTTEGLVQEALVDGAEPLSLINEELVPALDAVGRKFEEGSLYLPQLLRSAEAAKAAFGIVKSKLPQNEAPSKGPVLIATVKGDIHDIGKNIVKVLLENYGYRVIDLGKDVTPEDIARVASEEHAPLVGLSALMTTTVPAMEETIRLLRKTSPNTKVIVGGAVLSASYAAQIGADAYGKDGMATVRYADSLFA